MLDFDPALAVHRNLLALFDSCASYHCAMLRIVAAADLLTSFDSLESMGRPSPNGLNWTGLNKKVLSLQVSFRAYDLDSTRSLRGRRT